MSNTRFPLRAVAFAIAALASLPLAAQTLPAPTNSWPAKVFAPYAYIPRNSFFITNSLAQSGQKFYTLAFIICDPQGAPAWDGSAQLHPDTDYYSDQINAIRAAGGDVLISFGGAGGSELALKTTNAADLQTKYQSVIAQYKLTWMDFDIEGRSLANLDAVHRRNQAIAQLQSRNPGLRVSFTLPVNPTGMEPQSIALLNDAKQCGVKILSVNIMTMDYGSALSAGKNMGDLAIAAAEASHRQTQAIAPAIRIGITPMIGQNDQRSEIFTLQDAQAVMDFASKTDWVASIGFWSCNRDRAGGAARAASRASGIEQTNWAFTAIFKPFSQLKP